ncbi:MAG: ABC transporter ATP-binding protein [Alphaproteobacteria bacterium]|nr:ABC transporter ATP-binding protein [Alphaproteobacteria bacterium]
MNDAGNSTDDPVLVLDNVTRTFREGGNQLDVLNGVQASVKPGEIVALVGPSGSGKTTLLQVAGLLDRPDKGDVWIGGAACGKMTDRERTQTRRQRIGFVYQFHHLLPDFSALENVVLPQRIAGRGISQSEAHAKDLLGRLGLEERLNHRPGKLSGGERQRVAIARGVANNPDVLLGDEPTGNLDQRTADTVFQALLDLVREHNVSALIATHNAELAQRMDRTLVVHDGKLIPE